MNLAVYRDRLLREMGAAIDVADQQIADAERAEEYARALRREAFRTKEVLERATEGLEAIDPVERVKPDSRRIAGPAVIAATEEVLAKVGRTTQAEVVKATGRNSGSISHALRYLEDEGRVRKTGRRHNGSSEWAITPTKRERERVEAEAASVSA